MNCAARWTNEHLRRHATVYLLAGGLTLAALLTAATGDRTLARTVAEALIRVVIVVSLYIFVGNSGVISFGSIAFVMIGAYASAWQTCCSGLKAMTMTGLPDLLRLHSYPVFPASLASGALAALVALIAGAPILRLSGIPASIATFALMAIVYVVYSNWSTVTLGLLSVVGLPLYVNIWVALGWAVAAVVAAYVYQSSRFGLALRATREDEAAARAGGVNIARQRLLAWVISAFFLGVAGTLFGHFVGVISVNMFYLDLTFISLAMLVVGGMRSLTGAVVGVAALSVVTEILRQMEDGVKIATAEIKNSGRRPRGGARRDHAAAADLQTERPHRGTRDRLAIAGPLAPAPSPAESGRTGAMIDPSQLAPTIDRQKPCLDAFDRVMSARLKRLVTPALIAEHKRNPSGPHSHALEALLNYFRRANIVDKLAILVVRPFAEYRIVTLSGRRGVTPRVANADVYATQDEADHAVFLMRVRNLFAEPTSGPATEA